MLARCPACENTFAVVGRCSIPCPFCSAQIEVRLQRRQSRAIEVVTRLAAHDVVRRSGADDTVVRAGADGRVGLRIDGDPDPEWQTRTLATLVDVEVLVAPVDHAEQLGRLADDAFTEARAAARTIERLRAPSRSGASAAEDRGAFLEGWLRCLLASLLHPARFFAGLKADRWGRAPGFAGVQIALAALLFVGARPGLAFGARALAALTAFAVGVAFLGMLILGFHAGAELWLRRRVRWAAVGRVAAYGLAPAVAVAAPHVGVPLAVVWSAALHTVGLRRMLGTAWLATGAIVGLTWLVAATALLLPVS